MPSNDEKSITHWIYALKQGDPAAAQPLWERYFDRMVHVASAKLRSARRRGSEADGEDAALSAFDSFCRGAAAGRYPQLADRHDLWSLLVVITARKALDEVQHSSRQKRGGGRVRSESALSADPEGGPKSLDQVVGSVPTPEFAAMVAEQCQRLLDRLGEDTLRRIALWKLEGYTNEEIREHLGCSLKTVCNKLKLIRMRWEGGIS